MRNRLAWWVLGSLAIVAMVFTACGGSTATTTTSSTSAATSSPPATTTTGVGGGNWFDYFGEPQYGGTVVTVANANPPAFDPFAGMGPYAIWLEPLGMRKWELDRKIFPHNSMIQPYEYSAGLVIESWELPDPSTIIYHVRKGVRWALNPQSEASRLVNGREFTAYDIEWSTQREHGLGAFAGKGSPYMETPLKIVSSVSATDRYTVVFKSAYPTIDMQGILLENLPGNMLVPREVVEKWGDMNDWHHVVSTGPFMLTDYVSDSSITLLKNPNYYGYHEWYPQNKLPYADAWKVLIIPDVATAQAGLRTGKADLMQNLTWEQAASLTQTSPHLVQAKLPQSGVTLDMRCDTKPFTDINVRKALQMSVDLKTIAKSFYGGYADPTPWGFTGTPGYMTPYDKWTQELKDGYTYNPDGAKKLLAAAGYTTGFKTNIVMASNQELDLMQLVKDYFSKVNVDMEIRVMEPTAWSSFVMAGKSDQMTRGDNVGLLWPPAYTALQYYSKHFYNFTHNNDAAFDDLFNKEMASTSADERRQILTQMNDMALQKYWSVRLVPTALVNVWQPWLKGYSGEYGINRLDYVARMWVDSSMKRSMGH